MNENLMINSNNTNIKDSYQFSLINSQFNVIFWDFDGVILDSMKIKGDGFRELFKEYNKELLDKIEDYHYRNGGISRFEKIKYFYNQLLKQDITKEEIIELADKFAIIINKKLFDKNNLINETMEFIKNNFISYKFHIVSGAESNELNKLCQFFKIDKYFITIEGSPTKKDILIKNIIQKYKYNKKKCLMIGDSITDYKVAEKNGIKFFGVNYENPYS